MAMTYVLKDTAKYLDSFLSELSSCGIIGNYTILFLELATFDSFEESCVIEQICQLINNLQAIVVKYMSDSHKHVHGLNSHSLQKNYLSCAYSTKNIVCNCEKSEVSQLPFLNLKKKPFMEDFDEQDDSSRNNAFMPEFVANSNTLSSINHKNDTNVMSEHNTVRSPNVSSHLIKEKSSFQQRNCKKILRSRHLLDVEKPLIEKRITNSIQLIGEKSLECSQDSSIEQIEEPISRDTCSRMTQNVKDPLPSRISRIVEESLKTQVDEFNISQKDLKYPISPCEQVNSTFIEEFSDPDSPSYHPVDTKSSGGKASYDDSLINSSDNTELTLNIFEKQNPNKTQEKIHQENQYPKTVFANIVKFNPSDLDEHPWCIICQRAFPSSGSLKRHLTTSHNEVHWCHTCLKNFTSKSAMKSHVIEEHPEVKNICLKCGKQFRSHSNLQRHMKIHLGQRGTACEICGQTFARREYFREHKRVHTGEKPFTCNICQKTFSKSSNLTAHALIHKPISEGHKCNMCPKTFRRLDKLKEHTMRHLKIKRFQCGLCNKAYSEKRDLAKHMKAIHKPNEIS